jgi:hypothetical protein
MDFTVKKYKQLLYQFIDAGYHFQTFAEFLESPAEKVIMLRHDVDDKKLNSLHFAEIQNKAGVKGSYYFRMVPQSFDEEVIRKIVALGHEIGYHYEDMDFASSKFKVQGSKFEEAQLYDAAIEIFKTNLEKLRKLYVVKTICMHGSPRSRFDNKAVWKKYNYRDYGIIGEPYFDIDFNDVFYLTDTGRRWDGDKFSVRDKVDSSKFEDRRSKFHVSVDQPVTSDEQPATSTRGLKFHSTGELIEAAKNNILPGKIMFTFHPQRWTDNPIPWVKELLFQNLKNQIKKYYIKQS